MILTGTQTSQGFFHLLSHTDNSPHLSRTAHPHRVGHSRRVTLSLHNPNKTTIHKTQDSRQQLDFSKTPPTDRTQIAAAGLVTRALTGMGPVAPPWW